MVKTFPFYKFNRHIPIFLWAFSVLAPCISNAVSVKSYSYDRYGNLEKITDPRGFITQYHYDCLNRVEKIDFQDGKNVKYSYDLSGVRIKMEDHHGITSFEPDEFGRINKVTFPDGQSVSYRYDLVGNLIKLIYPDDYEVEYAYDLSNRLEAIKDFSGITKFEYDELSNTLKKKILPNGVTTDYQYHKTRKTSNVTHKKSDGSLIEEFRYTYDENGNRTKIEKITPQENSTITYTYDRLNRLTRAEYSDGFFEEFTYDGAGNRSSVTTPKGTITYEYESDENRLIKAGNTVFVYDLSGNLIEKSSSGRKAIYTYDVNNRLTAYSDESSNVIFEYDGSGNRISKTVNGIRTEYINDLIAPISQVLLKRIQGNWWKGEKKIHYVYGGSRISQSAEGKTQFYLYDSSKNVTALVNASGKVLNSYDYDAFGYFLSEEQNIPNVYKYSGEQFDEETGLIFLRNRYYDPEIGRFISKDPLPGRLNRPSTLNSYLYVNNNPVNFIDPLGLEELTVFADFPNDWDWGDFGHGWSELKDKDGSSICRGNYFGGPQDDSGRATERTASVKFEISTEQALLVAEILENPGEYHLLKNNCIDMVAKVLDVCEVGHPSFKDFIGISQPTKLHRWIGQHDNAGHLEATIKPSLGMSSLFPLDFGGVSLAKTAELQLSIADITGAAFDPATGQIILFGPQDRHLPPVDLDDLAVAIKSVYGIGTPPQDPGISMDFSTGSPGQVKVRYDGATANTAFGQAIFEADYLLKCLALGKNNITGLPFNLNVPGYSNILNRLAAHQWTGGQLDLIRFWFIPSQITLVEAEDHKGMVFSDVRMKVMTEALLKGSPTDHPASREFAENFTTYYDDFAKQLPILEKLKNLGKITAIVKWLRENNIPFDTSFFANYQPKWEETPNYVAPIETTYQWTSRQIERRHVPGHKHKKKVEVDYTYTIPISGGVVYRLNNQNFATYKHPAANEFAYSALTSRPSENDFCWSFNSPTNQETLIAVAQSIHRTKKPGNVKKFYTDMSFSVPGSQKLSLQRIYNSFSEKESPFGQGWRMIPYELELPTEKIRATAENGQECISYPMILVRTPEGEDFYQLCMLSNNELPILKGSINSNFLQDNLNGTFTLFIPHVGHMDFDSQGRLLKILDAEGIVTEYQFRDHHLAAIRHQNGSAILLEYEGDRMVKALGPGNSIVQYAYHSNGQLAAVGDVHKIHVHYSYDPDKRLNKVTDHLDSVLFAAEYDDYNRATAVREGSISYQSDFSLEKKTMKTTDSLGRESILQFDDRNRLIHQEDSSGLNWEFAYEQDDIHFPTKVTDPKGGITKCRYDPLGNLLYLKNPVGAEWRFFYDLDGNLIAQKEPNGRAIVNMYDRKNRLDRTFLKASLKTDKNDCFASDYSGFRVDGQYAVYFCYDAETGQLTSRRNVKEAQTSFTYHKNGQLKEIIYPTGYVFERKVDEKGNVLEISDGFSIQRSYDYDETNRIKAIRTAAGTTHFTYDDGGDLKLILDPRGFTTSYSYDSQHNLKEVTDGEGGISAYEYNSLNQLTHLTLPNGSCKTIEYDSFGRLYREIWGQ